MRIEIDELKVDEKVDGSFKIERLDGDKLKVKVGYSETIISFGELKRVVELLDN